MCEEAYRVFNLPHEDAAVVLIKVMDAVVKANSTMQFEVNVAGLDERKSGRPLFAACETKKKRPTSWRSKAYFFCTL